jgi:RND family efflux transporter MFP subunit
MNALRSIAVTTLVVASAFAATQPDSTPSPAANATVDVASAPEPPSQEPIRTTGQITLVDAQAAHVSSPVTGRVAKVHVLLGQRVKKGDPLVTIVPPDFDPTSELLKAAADALVAKRNYERQKQLCEIDCVRADIEAAADGFRRARWRLELERRKRSERGTVDASTTLPSPVDGEVLLESVRPGVLVEGQTSGRAVQELFVIGGIDPVWVLVDVNEEDIGRVQVGAAVVVRAASHPDGLFTGEIDWVSPQIDPILRTAKARCTVPNPEGTLRPGMSVGVEIEPRARAR